MLSLRARLMAGYLVLLAVVAVATTVLASRALTRSVGDATDRRLRGQVAAVAAWMQTAGHPERLAPRLGAVTAAGVQIVGADGVVLGDSLDPAMVGVAVGDAPEIVAALRDGEGRARRPLGAGGPAMYLLAQRDDDGRAIRLAIPLAELDAAAADLRGGLLLAVAIGLAAALLLGVLAIRAVTRPLHAMTVAAARLTAGDYAPTAIGMPVGNDEFAVLGRTLTTLAAELAQRIGELTAARDLSAAVVDALVEGVIAVDDHDRVVLINHAATTVLGTPLTIGQTLPPTLASHVVPSTSTDVELSLADRLVRVSTRPLPSRGGTVVVLYDITQLRALERVRRDFLANATHELRTPVTAIAGFAETLRSGHASATEADEFLDAIHRNAQRIATLVASLLLLEKLDARPTRLAARLPVALAPVVARAVATAVAARTDSTACVVATIAPDAVVLGDETSLEQIIQNLLDNALAYGGPHIVVEARHLGDRIALDVRDDGVGIAPAHQARVFERFYRVARTGAGTGLGLAIVAQLADAVGGHASLHSAPGATVFTVEFDGVTQM